jgi:hypothetical protein
MLVHARETVSRQFFKTRRTPFLPARPEPAETGSFPVYIEFPSVARAGDFFSILNTHPAVFAA